MHSTVTFPKTRTQDPPMVPLARFSALSTAREKCSLRCATSSETRRSRLQNRPALVGGRDDFPFLKTFLAVAARYRIPTCHLQSILSFIAPTRRACGVH